MAFQLDTPCHRNDVIKLLMTGARATHVLRLMVSDLAQLGRGYSYVLRRDGVPLAAAGFWPCEEPPSEIAAAAGGRPVFVAWFVAGLDAAEATKLIVRLARIYIRRLVESGALVIADIDPDHDSGPRLAQLVGMGPLVHLQGHDLWSTDTFERDRDHG